MPVEHGLRFGLALPQLAGEVDEIAAHVLHRARELADFRRAARRESRWRNRPRPSRTAASVSASTGPRHELAEQHAREHREHGEARAP